MIADCGLCCLFFGRLIVVPLLQFNVEFSLFSRFFRVFHTIMAREGSVQLLGALRSANEAKHSANEANIATIGRQSDYQKRQHNDNKQSIVHPNRLSYPEPLHRFLQIRDHLCIKLCVARGAAGRFSHTCRDKVLRTRISLRILRKARHKADQPCHSSLLRRPSLRPRAGCRRRRVPARKQCPIQT